MVSVNTAQRTTEKPISNKRNRRKEQMETLLYSCGVAVFSTMLLRINFNLTEESLTFTCSFPTKFATAVCDNTSALILLAFLRRNVIVWSGDKCMLPPLPELLPAALKLVNVTDISVKKPLNTTSISMSTTNYHW